MGTNGEVAEIKMSSWFNDICGRLTAQNSIDRISKFKLLDEIVREASLVLSPIVGLEDGRTISAQAHEARARGEQWAIDLCSLLDTIDPDHCLKAFQNEKMAGSPGVELFASVINRWQVDALIASAVVNMEEQFPGFYSRIISGRRSLAAQRALQERWDRGNRTGLAVRPAMNSRHLAGMAIDVDLRDLTLAEKALRGRAWMKISRRHRWGGLFNVADENHFDIA